MSIAPSLYYLYSFFLILAAVNLALIPIIFVMHFFVPKVMQRTYFKEPYFSPTEVELFTGFPLAYMRTAMMMRLAGWPESGKKRGIPANAHEVAPIWFQVVSRVFIRIFLTLFSVLIISCAVVGVVITVVEGW